MPMPKRARFAKAKLAARVVAPVGYACDPRLGPLAAAHGRQQRGSVFATPRLKVLQRAAFPKQTPEHSRKVHYDLPAATVATHGHVRLIGDQLGKSPGDAAKPPTTHCLLHLARDEGSCPFSQVLMAAL